LKNTLPFPRNESLILKYQVKDASIGCVVPLGYALNEGRFVT